MATITGDIISLNRLDTVVHAVGAVVLIRQGRKTIATAEVTDNDDFTVEIPDELRGEIEISLGLVNAAPSLAIADGNDIHATVLFNNANNFIAG